MTRPIAWVTGANRGIGRGISAALAARGFDLVGTDLDENDDTRTTGAMVEEAGGSFRFLQGDIGHAGDAADLAAAAMRDGPIHCLVNNAGLQTRQRVDILELPEAEFDRLMAVNLRGTFFLTQAVAKAMLADEAVPGRSIVSITSVAARAANPMSAAYCMTKAGLSMMVRLFALRLAASGIASFEVRPGLIRTPMNSDDLRPYLAAFESGRVPYRDWGQIDQVGKAVATLASGDIPYSTGEVINVAGGFQIEQIA
ncbi:MAG: 3-ketoacyl-ACP reductase [Candidatus Andeanibacterium colombiense]|uniref:3-ketoacyl-ACP reductase n=1 Tax=Candidatus Andeanibacterium colombiense TaxID=3121345 RepID=A0AAJ5X273_9SPHN|nr:MAG: 3-ketoacyl-ACP reductase [Sphingomonadaceae bacterium]